MIIKYFFYWYNAVQSTVHHVHFHSSWSSHIMVILQNTRVYLTEIYSHKFVFCPRGNGIDTHRLWETLYLRSIPIVKKCIGMEQFKDLPILFIDNWNNITVDFLNKKYDEIHSKEYPLYKLSINYWLNLIYSKINYKEGMRNTQFLHIISTYNHDIN